MYQLPKEYLTKETRSRIVDSEMSLFWSDDWSKEYYRNQARLGFIAVAVKHASTCLLIPELQPSYAVLEWQNLSVDRGVKRALDTLKEQRIPLRLSLERDPGPVLYELEKAWGPRSWLYPPYQHLIQELATSQERHQAQDFQIWGVRLLVGSESFPVAGELGYLVGGVYTSLSGFFHREDRRWNHLGKAQMVLFAEHLRSRGVRFWNLGHPQMQYKITLGAKVLNRRDFLALWDEGVDQELPELGD